MKLHKQTDVTIVQAVRMMTKMQNEVYKKTQTRTIVLYKMTSFTIHSRNHTIWEHLKHGTSFFLTFPLTSSLLKSSYSSSSSLSLNSLTSSDCPRLNVISLGTLAVFSSW